MEELKDNIASLLYEYENPSRIALSKKYPSLRAPLVQSHRLIRHIENVTNSNMRLRYNEEPLPVTIAKHQSVLRRRLGDSDPQLQEKKIINLQQAIKRINEVVIDPNRIFSFWAVIGKPKYKNGNYFRYNEIYRDMLIEGKVMQTNLITINFAPVVYEVSEEYLSKQKFPVIEF